MRVSTTALTLTAYTSFAAAQNSTIVYNNTQINVQTPTQYSGNSLIGYHIGAALSYIVARAPGYGSSFAFNLSATSTQLLDNDIVAGYQLPCYVVNTPQISNNSGPLECGAGEQTGYYDVAKVTLPNSANPGVVSFNGINQWYVCAVQSFTYGWVQGTIVGLFRGGVPLGPGVTNCTLIDALVFATTSKASTSLTVPPTTTMTANSTVVTPYFNVTSSTTVLNSNSTTSRTTLRYTNSTIPLTVDPNLTTQSTTSFTSTTSKNVQTTSGASVVDPVLTSPTVSTATSSVYGSTTSSRSVSTVYPLYTPPASSSALSSSPTVSDVNPISTSVVPASGSPSPTPFPPLSTSSISVIGSDSTSQTTGAVSSLTSVAPTVNPALPQTTSDSTTLTTVAVPYSYNGGSTAQASSINSSPPTTTVSAGGGSTLVSDSLTSLTSTPMLSTVSPVVSQTTSHGTTMTTVAVPYSYGSDSTNTSPTTTASASFNPASIVATYTATRSFVPIATYLGAAASLDTSSLLGLTLALAALLM